MMLINLMLVYLINMIELKVMNLFICSIAESVFILDQQVLFDKIVLLFIVSSMKMIIKMIKIIIKKKKLM
jgi:hypothetical protein